MTKRASKWGAALRHLLLGSPMMMLIAVLIVVALVILGTKAARWMVQNNHLVCNKQKTGCISGELLHYKTCNTCNKDKVVPSIHYIHYTYKDNLL